MSDRLFNDRRDAGRALAGLLDRYRGRRDLVVLAVPRGGVPAGYEVARALGAPLDVLVTRKLGVPGQEDLAMGAIAGDGALSLCDDVIRGLAVPPQVIEHVAGWEGREIARWEERYRQGLPEQPVEGKVAILVDDGLATGTAMRAAVKALRRSHPARVVIALPAASQAVYEELAVEADEIVCATTPPLFFAADASYWDFIEVTVEDVRDLLRASALSVPPSAGGRPPCEVAAIRSESLPVEGGVPAPEVLSDLVGDAHVVLIGGASHGTHEFYAARAVMTRHLIEEKGFGAVAVQADWPDAYRVNRYVQGRTQDGTGEEALRGFQRFPVWMWRNTVVLGFVRWLREHNDLTLGGNAEKAGFYGLDLYGMHRAMYEVIRHLDGVDPAAAARARERYACFDHLGSGDGRMNGISAACGAGDRCEDEVVGHLVSLRRNAMEEARKEGLLAEDELFYAELNAATIRSADEYYRSMFGGRICSWNRRDLHMADTLDALLEHLGRRHGRPAKIVVWAHNAHVGDARATEAACRGEIDMGQIIRERHGSDCRVIGFTTYTGTVTAAGQWGGPAERKWLRPALSDSVEELFHEVGEKEFLTSFGNAPRSADVLRSARLERMVAAVYRPQTERRSHYYRSRLRDQFDAVIHIDETRAVEPLDRMDGWGRPAPDSPP
ncbi:erythromycin esterase family protein [Sphaerisporangium corydalis]|uniref:Erythromycin esterase family protein n=1 Tax=Sphaerisporangium corydalis TaxID=1441875 RepID=A0ABV9EDT2_9ACTN|nr:erythromycin esterase family protein [Sphaerisporangium corydalis]